MKTKESLHRAAALYRQRHPDREAARKIRWLEKNRDHHNEYQREYIKEKMKDPVKAAKRNKKARAWYKKNKEKCREKNRRHYLKKKAANA